MAANLERRLLFRGPFDRPAPALFLDRDGVLIDERHYIADQDAVSLCSGSMRLLRLVHQSGWPVVVITNQSVIGRGYFSWHDYDAVTARMLELIGLNLQTIAIYANGYPHDSSSCFWRKPNPGMLMLHVGILILILGDPCLLATG